MPKPTILQRLADWLAPETRSAFPGGPGLAGPGSGRPAGASGSRINDRSALSIAAVWAAVNCYVNTIGSMDFYVAARDGRGGRRPATEHPAYELLKLRPNGRSTSMRLRQAWIGHAATRGNGYLEIERRGRVPVGLHLLDPRSTEPVEEGGRVVYRQARGPDLPAEDVLHLAMFGWDGLKGYSPIEFGRQTLGVAASQRDYQAGLFDNSAAAQGHLEVPGNLKSLEKSQLRAHWNRMHQGPDNAGNVGILEGGMRWVQTNFSPQDAEIIAGGKFSVEEIARFWGLPQHKLNLLDNANFGTVEEMNIDFFQSSILPWLKGTEQECDLKLMTREERREYFTYHDFKGLLRGNVAAETARDVALFGLGARTVNQLLIADGLDPIDDPRGDYHWLPVNNLAALEAMGPAASPPPAQALPTPGPPPAQAPDAGPAPATLAALRAVLADALGRSIRRECAGARRASRYPDLDGWAAAYYPGLRAAAERDLAPALAAIAAATGRPADAAAVAGELAEESRRQLRELVVSVPPDEMPGAVDRLCSRWESGRAAALALAIVPDPDTPDTDTDRGPPK